MSLRVLTPGALTTVQDRGRVGWRHLGVGLAGALDPDAAALANRLVGNPADAAVLELTLHGPTLQLMQPVRMAICGADVAAWFKDETGMRSAVEVGRRIELPPGTLQLGAIHDGLRAWVAFAGGIELPRILGSRSTDLRGGFGGHEGRALRRGDELALGSGAMPECRAPRITPWWVDAIEHDRDAPVRYVASAHPMARRLERGSWRVSAHSNRQGLRLEGDALLPIVAKPADAAANPISAAVAPGTLQCPPDGQPIVLLADAQTVGGYSRLGHVIAADLPRLAQSRPGEVLRFSQVDARDAVRASTLRQAQFARLHYAIADRGT